MSILTVGMNVYHMCEVWSPLEVRRQHSTGTGVRDNCEPSCVCWELDWTEPGLSERTACALNCGEPSPQSFSYWNCDAIIKDWGLEDDGSKRDYLALYRCVFILAIEKDVVFKVGWWGTYMVFILKFEFTKSFAKKGLERRFSG